MMARSLGNSLHRTAGPAALGTVIAIFAIANYGFAATYNVSATVNGTYQQIGTLDAVYQAYAGGGKAEEGVFQLNAANKFLMNDVCDCEFRWFQVVTEDTSPINYLGSPLAAAYVDPPANGWDYERTPANNYTTGTPGGDSAPFYEDDDSWPGTSAYGKYSGTLTNFGGTLDANAAIHNATTGTLRTQDVPGLQPSSSLKFMTFVSFMNSAMKSAKEFDVLWGYSWGISAAANGTLTYDNIVEITDAGLTDDGLQGTIINAMGADGFNGWTPVFRNANLTVTCVPEPASFVLFLMAGCTLVIRERRK